MSSPSFVDRHLGLREKDAERLLAAVGDYQSVDEFLIDVIPASIRLRKELDLPEPLSEREALAELRSIASRNEMRRNFIGLGYHGTFTPPVIQRNILENPGWYTAYTPYQAEIAQGRLEALLNFQTMVADLTGMDVSNASLLDEATAAAEAMVMAYGIAREKGAFFVANDCHPATIAVLETRAEAYGIRLHVGAVEDFAPAPGQFFAALFQYPATDGGLHPLPELCDRAHAAGALVIVATDLLALTLLLPPGEAGADIAVGSSQRFGVPIGCGGPHAAFLATRDEHKRRLPGRLVGVSRDVTGKAAYRLTLQTREQHIRREKATSNICTAQVLLAVIASMYAVYHGPEGLRSIAQTVHGHAFRLASLLRRKGLTIRHERFFDTIWIENAGDTAEIRNRCREAAVNLRWEGDSIGISVDELTTQSDTDQLIWVVTGEAAPQDAGINPPGFGELARSSNYLTHPVFHAYRTETELQRYLRRLEARDLSLTTSMIPLGSCTMKLNAAAEMFPVTWPEFASPHPFAPSDQLVGYAEMISQLESWLGEITGLPAVSLQPNAGSQGEYAGLLAIRRFHESCGQTHRRVCLIPHSAHGTNPASAVMAGMEVVGVRCDDAGNIDVSDLKSKIQASADRLAAVMITYPSTHGVFEEGIDDICHWIHEAGGQVYLDGANMNAQVGLCRPGDFGADVCHLNLHKTFCIPHGGGGPGIGPICAAEHLRPFLPGKPLPGERLAPVSQAPWGSAGILPISWMFIRMMGPKGLTESAKIAILNANYIAARLSPYYQQLYKGAQGRVAHECILDLREWKQRAGVEVEDVAKRLMDYGFHSPTMSWPEPGTLMVEPTESEAPAELDRFCEAMIAIHGEMLAIERGESDRQNNSLKNAPHTAEMVTASDWHHPYSRELAAFPTLWLRDHKYWPPVGRVDNVYGDRNVFCSCVPLGEALRS